MIVIKIIIMGLSYNAIARIFFTSKKQSRFSTYSAQFYLFVNIAAVSDFDYSY